MVGMTTQDRLDDICAISGLSEDIVRRVFDAERQSIVKSLRKGERATMIGRCVIRPEIRTKIEIGGEIKQFIKLYSNVAASMEAYLSDLTDFEVDDTDYDPNKLPDGIMITQIPSLV